MAVTMSDEQIRALFKAIDGINRRLDSFERAIADLRNVDRQHWSAIDSGQFETEQMNLLVQKHERALKEAHTKGRNKALAATIVPAVVGVVELCKTVIENWPF